MIIGIEQAITQHGKTLQEWCRIISDSYGYYIVENPDKEEYLGNHTKHIE